MNDSCPTVLIQGPNGEPVIVNKSDFDADQAEGGKNLMELHPDEGNETKPLVLPPVVPAYAATVADLNLAVIKDGTGAKAKFFVVRADGSRVADIETIDVGGYATDADAWAAIQLAPKPLVVPTVA